jgi:hypothetical protein
MFFSPACLAECTRRGRRNQESRFPQTSPGTRERTLETFFANPATAIDVTSGAEKGTRVADVRSIITQLNNRTLDDFRNAPFAQWQTAIARLDR